MTGFAVCEENKEETKGGPLVGWLTTPAARTSKAPPRRRALDCAPGSGQGSHAIREASEGLSRLKPGCTVQINEGSVGASEPRAVTSEAPERAGTRRRSGRGKLQGRWPSSGCSLKL